MGDEWVLLGGGAIVGIAGTACTGQDAKCSGVHLAWKGLQGHHVLLDTDTDTESG